MIQRFEGLEVWKKAHTLVLAIYKVTRYYPDIEKYCLVTQMRRCAASVPANIAEGFKRRSYKDKAHFYNIAQGSLEELRYFLILSVDLGYLEPQRINSDDIDHVGRMLNALSQGALNKAKSKKMLLTK